MRKYIYILSAVLFVVAFSAVSWSLQQTGEITIDPANIEIGWFYNGTKVNVRAIVPADGDVVVQVVGDMDHVTLKKKGKVAGVLWMNVGEVTYTNVPDIYLYRSSRSLSKMADSETLNSLMIGYDAIRQQSTDGPESDEWKLFDHFIKLKTKEALYSSDERGVHFSSTDRAGRQAAAESFLPAKVPGGKYKVEVFIFRNGRGELLGSDEIQITFSSYLSFIKSLDENHGLLYGILAVLVALVAGGVIGLIFGAGKGGH